MPLQLSQPRNPIHLYRHLLREASYLPPVCRHFIASRVQAQFRQHRNDPAPKRRLQKANHDLRYLRAANAGDLSRVRKILLLAFGRTGKRRRELMQALRRKEPPANAEELEDQIQRAPPRQDWLDKWDTDKLLAFAKSQGRQGFNDAPRPEVKFKQLDLSKVVPPMNAWGRPFAKKVARNKLKKWWKGLAHRIMPPVGKGEWELLQTLATGQGNGEWEVPKRRAAPQMSAQEGRWNWEEYLTKPVRAVDRQSSRQLKILTAEHNRDEPGTGAHTYTPRLWRRLYAQIWRMTATMEKSSAAEKWDIKWGKMKFRPVAPSPPDHEFFKGVDTNGMKYRNSIAKEKAAGTAG